MGNREGKRRELVGGRWRKSVLGETTKIWGYLWDELET